MSASLYIGIDPSQVKPTAGTSGSIVILQDGEPPICIRLNQTRKDVIEQFREATQGADIAKCYLEKVHTRPGDGRASAFTFGEGYGFLQGMLLCCNIPFETISPVSWMGAMVGRRGRNTSKTAWKNYLKGRAQELFPNEKIILANADAYLLAAFAKRKVEGNAIRKRPQVVGAG